jgi:hypothetical protein
MSKKFHSATSQILIVGWQLMTSAWHHECNYMELHSSWMSCFDGVAIELQWVSSYIRWVVALQFIQFVR